ncbi:MAG: IS21 family transposase, partial [Mycobacterium sp.]
VDPVDRFIYQPGEIAQCDLWFPKPPIPVGGGQERVLPVLVMVLGYSRFISARMIPSRQGGDILSGMWSLISALGRVPRTLVWDREAAIGGTGRVTTPAVAFAGTLATQIKLAPARDPEYKGVVERANGYLETSFLPGRQFSAPTDFNTQVNEWLLRANTRTVRAIRGRPVDLLETDYLAMLPLPPVVPPIGLHHRVRLARDYYVRVDAVDYSVDPRVIGRFVDVSASPDEVLALCDGQLVARHRRCWAKHGVIADAAHVATAAALRHHFADERRRRQNTRHHLDGHRVALRALPDYDALFGVDFGTDTARSAADSLIGTERTP